MLGICRHCWLSGVMRWATPVRDALGRVISTVFGSCIANLSLLPWLNKWQSRPCVIWRRLGLIAAEWLCIFSAAGLC